MTGAGITASALRPDDKALCRAGGASALALGLSYVAIVALFAVAGAVPTGAGEQWLRYIGAEREVWWAITVLSVVTDVLFLPLAAALYVALKAVKRNAMLAGVALLVLFVVWDLAVTWPSYASLIVLSGDHAAASGEAQRAAIVAAASYPASILRSGLWASFAIVVPALGILAIGLVMLDSPFGRVAGYTGVLTGVLGFVSVAGPLAWSQLGALAIPTSVLTTVWVVLVGYRLIRIAASATSTS